jgi:uncharacterized protein (TIGR00255 family)
MIKSMTGFGQSSFDDGKVVISVEVKSLNSKFLDLNLRLPKSFSSKELDVRNLLSEKLERGKLSVVIEHQRQADGVVRQTYNEALFVAYYNQLRKLADRVLAPHDNLFELALNSPEVIQNNITEETSEDDWKKIKQCLEEAMSKCDTFRKDEGKVLEKMLVGCCLLIEQCLEQVKLLDPKRVERVRERIRGNVALILGEEGIDPNRLEQEIIFYIEKLDINEEKVRLKSHLDYFIKVLKEDQSGGKKLGFISQEIGREINTIGSKANDAEIQKQVVVMKEELEKIKEQLNNVL